MPRVRALASFRSHMWRMRWNWRMSALPASRATHAAVATAARATKVMRFMSYLSSCAGRELVARLFNSHCRFPRASWTRDEGQSSVAPAGRATRKAIFPLHGLMP